VIDDGGAGDREEKREVIIGRRTDTRIFSTGEKRQGWLRFGVVGELLAVYGGEKRKRKRN